MKYLYFVVLLCFNLVGCGNSTVPIVKHEVVYIKPPAQFRMPCGYVNFDIARDDYLHLSSVDKEQYLFSVVKESIVNTAQCNKMIESLNNWIDEADNGN